MVDIERIFRRYKEHTIIRETENAVFVGLPFFFIGYDEGIAIKISEKPNGQPVLSDCHTTLDYLEIEDVEIDDYRDKLAKIMDRYSLIQDGNVFRMTVPNDDEVTVRRYIGYFIQAISLIANIAL